MQGAGHTQFIFLESEHFEGRPPQKADSSPSRKPIQTPARRARTLPPRSMPVCAGAAGKGVSGSSAASSGPAAPHASRRLSLRFGPHWASSDRLARDAEPDALRNVTHRGEGASGLRSETP